jgi:BCCT family betaine/carnitine transporter
MIAFYATSFDSIAYTAACYSYKKLDEDEHPHKLIELLWCLLLIVLPIALVFSESSMNNIQSVSIISAFPIGIIMIIMIWSFFKDSKKYMEERDKAELSEKKPKPIKAEKTEKPVKTEKSKKPVKKNKR